MRNCTQVDLQNFAELNYHYHIDQVQGQIAATGPGWADLVYW